VGYSTQPLRVFLPSFGDWGFVMAKLSPFLFVPIIPSAVTLRCLDSTALSRLTEFPSDTHPEQTAVNRLGNQTLVHSYLDETKRLD
jgi:spermidine synthase